MKSVMRWIFTLPKHQKNLDPSYKTDLDFWDCFIREKLSYKMDLDFRDCFEWKNKKNLKNLDPSYNVDLDFWVALVGKNCQIMEELQ